MDREPLVSIVTPCLNAERFIERTVESVLAQDYPRIEYIVVDGQSTDGTLQVLQRYGERIHYRSERDGGVAEAINRGFSMSSGSIFAWLNADDVYLPGAVRSAVRRFLATPGAAVVYGEGCWVDEQDAVISRYPTVNPFRPEILEQECCICQPASFISREAFEMAGGVDAKLHNTFDYDLWIRLSRKRQFFAVPDCLATSRMHRANITLGQRKLVFEENMQLLRRHFGYVPVKWIYGYLSYLRDGRDQFFEPLQHSSLVYLRALFEGTRVNFKHPLKYWREWSSAIKLRTGRRAIAA